MTSSPTFLRSFLLAATLICTGGAAANAATALLNEYNAGGSTTPAGDWFEIVVVGAGISGSTVDMRGWEFRVDNTPPMLAQQRVGAFRLSQNAYWSDVRAGTIITFFETDASTPAPPTSILQANNFGTEGWGHTNINIDDTAFIDGSFILQDVDYPIDENSSQFTILDRNGNIIFGPAGEGHAGYAGGGVNDLEVFKLEANPSPSITLASPYNDGSTSTFGAPNRWTNDGLQFTQDFSAFVIPEPGSVSMLLMGAVGVLGKRRRRR
ncbi:MAG TPA: PEP-CTERM sorting domain-containing protein [Chthoniobacteraceae bacterium]|jgi:hypothetical protein